jgi:DNA-binding protein H-NS
MGPIGSSTNIRIGVQMARTTVEAQLAKLKKQREAIEAKEKALLAKSNEKAIAEIIGLVMKYGVTQTELIAALAKRANKAPRKAKAGKKTAKPSDKRAKVAPKYRNPNDANQTWTGRGRTPVWVQALKDAGTLDAALIAVA